MRKLFALVGIALIGTVSSDAQTILLEDFESASAPALPGGWSKMTKAATAWKTATGNLDFTNGWRVKEHTKYAVVDDWNNNETNDSSMLVSPSFTLMGATNPYVAMDYYFAGAAYSGGSPKETAYLRISTDGGNVWSNIDTLDADGDDWQYTFKSLAAYIGQPNVRLAVYYHDGGDATKKLIGLAVDYIKVYTPAANDIRLISMTPEKGSPKNFGIASGNITVGGMIINYGSSPITSFDATYKTSGGTLATSTMGSINVASFAAHDFTCSNPLALPATLGSYNVDMWVTLPGDMDASNDSAKTDVTIANFMPKKKILAEEGTGTWCGFCPRGAVYMDSIGKTHPDNFSLIAVHNGDPMVVPAYDTYIGTKIGGYPSMVIDRRDERDPSDLFDIYDEQKDYFGYADITLTDVPAPSFNYALKASVKPAIDLSGDYRLALALVEDGVTGTASGYDQSNYYAGGGYGPMGGYENKPSKVPASEMVYNHVARMIVPSPTGAAGSLPATMTAGNTYDYTFNTVIPQPYKRPKMHAVVMLIRNSDGVVLNSNNIKVPLGISNVAAGITATTVYPNPAAEKATLRFTLAEHGNVQVLVYDMTGRIVHNTGSKACDTGANSIDINTAALPAGVYTIKMQADGGNITLPLSIAK
ncbi:hypothetical protein CAP35_03070 [Chitinophagaceae bacterium IBVUCB1]|nr:hypothetical protein CAP35_03070 [Chitinophagaceae bacterium IBVUCB1]